MSVKRRIYTSLDIGTTSIKIIVAEIINNDINVIGVSTQESRGIKKGVIVDIDQTISSIKIAVDEAEKSSNVTIQDVIIGLPAYGLEINQTRGVVKTQDPDGEISNQDIKNVVSQAMIQSIAQDKELMGLDIKQFVVDGFDDITDPRGMIGVRLEIDANVFSVPKTMVHSIKKSVEMAGLSISDIVLQPDALAALMLNRDQMRQGAVLIDLGGGQSTAAIYKDNKLFYSFVDPEGGEYVSRDISLVLNTSLEEAELLKIRYGYAHPADANPDGRIPVNVLSQKSQQDVSEEYLAEIINARLNQILATIESDLHDKGLLETSDTVIVTGGNSSIPGIKRLLNSVFDMNIDLFVPRQMGIRYPTFSTAVGLIQYVKDLDDIQRMVNKHVNGLESIEENQPNRADIPAPKERASVQKILEVQPDTPEEKQNHYGSEHVEVEPDKPSRPRRQEQKAPEESWSAKIKRFFQSLFDFD